MDDISREGQGRKKVGHYELLGPLGEGGMGIIYRARHESDKHLVALKMVRIPNMQHLQGIRREIYSLSRISHPGIVRIVAHGLEAGIPWYAMELLEGMTLKDWSCGERRGQNGARTKTTNSILSFAARETVDGVGNNLGLIHSKQNSDVITERQPCSQLKRSQVKTDMHGEAGWTQDFIIKVLTVVYRLCCPLSYLHGEGHVHRDLKPANILVRPDGVPIIIDFGLTTQFGGEISREKLVVEPSAQGTLAYMAPEQIKNELVDARADIFALGCILYELLTGVHPFSDYTDTPQLPLQLFKEPVPPSKLMPVLPSELEDLILQMIEREARHRIGFVEDIAVQLKKNGAENGIFGLAPPARCYLYRADLAGRTEERKHIQRNLKRARAGHGEMVFVLGESGIGKTRLAIQAGREASEHNCLVLTGEASEGDYSALGLFRKPLQLLADRCRTRGEEETRRIFGRCGAVLMDFEPAIRGLPGLEQYPEPALLDHEAAKLRILTDLAEVIRNCAERQPVMLILDDLQWADQLSLEFLRFIQQNRNLHESRCLIVGLCRKEEVPPLLAEIFTACSDQPLSLGKLGPDHIRSIIRDMLATSTPPNDLCQFLISVAEGNPFFVAEYLRLAISMGIFSRNSLGQWLLKRKESVSAISQFEKLGLPRSLQTLLEKRICGLPTRVRRAVEITAIIGKISSVQLMWTVSGQAEEQLLEGLDELLRHQILEWDRPDFVRFSHDKLREIIIEQIPLERKRDIHARIVTAIETSSESSPDLHFAELGFHSEMAGNTVKAGHYYFRAAQTALLHFSYQETIANSERAVALLGSVEAKLLMAHALIGLARFEEADPISTSIVTSEQTTEREKTEALLVRAELRERQGRFDDSNTVVNHLLQRETVGLSRIKALIIGSRNFIRLGEVENAENLLIEALPLARAEGLDNEVASILNNLGIIARSRSQLGLALEMYDQSLTIRRRCHDRLGEAHLLVNISAIDYDRFQFKNSLDGQQKALTIYRELGHRYGIADCLSNIGSILQIMGRNHEALQVQQESLHIVHEIGNQFGIADSLRRIATVQLKLGHFNEARLTIERTLAIARSINHTHLELEALFLLGKIFRNLGDTQGALNMLNVVCQNSMLGGLHLVQARALIESASLQFDHDRILLSDNIHHALTLLEQYPEDQIIALGLLARFEAHQEHVSSACQLLAQANQLVTSIGNQETILKLKEDEARVYARLGRNQEFEQAIGEAESIAKRTDDTITLRRLKQLREHEHNNRGDSSKF